MLRGVVMRDKARTAALLKLPGANGGIACWSGRRCAALPPYVLLPLPPSAQSQRDRDTCNKSKNRDDIIAACTNVIDDRRESSRNRYNAYNSRGIAFSQDENQERAIADYNEALRLVPNDIDVLINRAISYRRMRDSDRAIREFTQVLKRNLNNRGRLIVYTNRGLAYADKDDFDRAIADYNEAIRLDPKDAASFDIRGDAWRDKGDYDRAIADYSEAIRLDPKNAIYLSSRCWARGLANRDLPQALTDCTELLRLRPDDDDTLDSRGFVHLRLNRLSDAIADYDAALKLAPKNANSLYGRGIAKLRKGDAASGKADIAAATAIRAEIAADFVRYGVTPPKDAPSPASAPDCSAAETHWKSAMVLDILAAYEDHLRRFPDCAFATLAKAKIEALKKR